MKEAREYFIENGFAYTLRPKRIKTGKEPLFYDKFEKKVNVFVEFIREISKITVLKQYVANSGFDSLDEWLERAKIANTCIKPPYYDITRIKFKNSSKLLFKENKFYPSFLIKK